MLEGCLIIDLEGGSEFLEALSIQARSVSDLGEIANLIRQKLLRQVRNLISILQLIMQHA